MIINPQDLSVKETYHLMTGCIMPRPIALVSTLSRSGVANLAPFSYFNGITSKPPTLMLGIARNKDGSKKDTLVNIEQTGEFVVHLTDERLKDLLSGLAVPYPAEVDEFAELGLEKIPSQRVQAPRLKDALISMECKLHTILEIGSQEAGAGFLVVGEIVLFHVADEILTSGRIDAAKVKPLARLNGPYYSSLGEMLT